MLVALTLLAASLPPGPVTDVCNYDTKAMLALDESAFDQSAEGWRSLETRGCDVAAANLISGWRAAHKSSSMLLFWHEGQLRANAGDERRAIGLFERSYKTEEEDAGFGWNLYVDGTLAFLRRDKPALLNARNRLASLPRPEGLNPKGPDGRPRRVVWPFNLNVLDGFIECWNKRYKAAYGCAKAPGN